MSVENALFRPATAEEVQKVKVGCPWRVVTFPWNITNKICSTAIVLLNRSNVLAWTPIRVFRWLSSLPPFLIEFPSFFLHGFQITDAKVGAAFFKAHRVSDVFVPSQTFEMIFTIIKQTFPSTEFDREDNIFSCNVESTKFYHGLFNAAFKDKEKISEIIKEEMSTALEQWSRDCRGNGFICSTTETRLIASKIITRVLLGRKTDNTVLCASVNFISKYIIKTYSGTLTEDDKEKFKEALLEFRLATNDVLESGEEIPLFANVHLTIAQKQALIFVTFFAGQETVASLLNFMIYELAKTPEVQREYKSLDTETIVHQKLNQFPSAYGVSRKLRTNVCLEYTIDGEKQTVILPEGKAISARMIDMAAKATPPFNNFSEWLPFGGGKHRCPGESLALAEIRAMVEEIKKGYTFTLSPTQEKVSIVGLVILQLDKDVYVHVERR